MCMGGGNSGASEAAAARRREQERQARIREGRSTIDAIFEGGTVGDETFSGFATPEFYDSVQNSFLDFYRPQLQEQQEDAQRQLTYDLASRGMLESSIAGEKFGDLQERLAEESGRISSQAQAARNDAIQRAESSRSNLYSLNESAADPSLVQARALASESTVRQPQVFSPLGQVFADITNQFAQNRAAQQVLNPRDRREGFRVPLSGSRSSLSTVG